MYIVGRLAVIRYIRDIMDQLNTTGSMLQYVDFDQTADIQDLPNSDLVGINGFAMTDMDRQYDVMFGVTITTINDPNLFRISKCVDSYFRQLLAGKTFLVYDEVTADQIGSCEIYTGTAVSPVERAEALIVQQIAVKARLILESPE